LARKIASSDNTNSKKFNNHYYIDGYYNNYNYRPGEYSQIRLSLCTNYLEFDGIVFGQFYCPIEGFESDEVMCCGPLKEQYCCNQNAYNAEKGLSGASNDALEHKKRVKDNIMFVMIILVPIIFFLLLLVGFFIFCCIKKRYYGRIPILASQREIRNNGEDRFEDDDESFDDEDSESVVSVPDKKSKKAKKVVVEIKSKKKSAEA
jgi:hypothetical protein